MSKRAKNGYNKTKIGKQGKFVKFSQVKHWKPCLRVKYTLGINFFDFLKDIREIEAKNAKPHYANEIKVRFFKKQSKASQAYSKDSKIHQDINFYINFLILQKNLEKYTFFWEKQHFSSEKMGSNFIGQYLIKINIIF